MRLLGRHWQNQRTERLIPIQEALFLLSGTGTLESSRGSREYIKELWVVSVIKLLSVSSARPRPLHGYWDKSGNIFVGMEVI